MILISAIQHPTPDDKLDRFLSYYTERGITQFHIAVPENTCINHPLVQLYPRAGGPETWAETMWKLVIKPGCWYSWALMNDFHEVPPGIGSLLNLAMHAAAEGATAVKSLIVEHQGIPEYCSSKSIFTQCPLAAGTNQETTIVSRWNEKPGSGIFWRASCLTHRFPY